MAGWWHLLVDVNHLARIEQKRPAVGSPRQQPPRRAVDVPLDASGREEPQGPSRCGLDQVRPQRRDEEVVDLLLACIPL